MAVSRFLAIDRVISPGPVAARLVPLVEAIASVARINRLVEGNAGKPLLEFLVEMERHGGRYEVRQEDLCVPAGPLVFFANHPLGGADSVAALRLLSVRSTDFRFLASRAIQPPPLLAPYLVRVDPTGSNKRLNVQSLGRISRGLGRDFFDLFVFPSGLCSHLDLGRRVVTDPPWMDGFARIASQSNASLVPVWFGGQNSWLYYVLRLTLGRHGTIALPAEFFRRKRQPLIAKIGASIPSRSTVFFGNQTLAALRASVYSLSVAEDSRTRAEPAPASPSAGYGLSGEPPRSRALASTAVDRERVLAFRHRSGAERWSETDELATHIVASTASGIVGYCRLVDWSRADPATLGRISALHSAYVPDPGLARANRIVEFDMLRVAPGHDGLTVVQSMWRAIGAEVLAGTPASLVLGVLGLEGHNPILASAVFEFARRSSASPLLRGFIPRRVLVDRSPHHEFTPARIEYEREPLRTELPEMVRTCLALGGRFGPSCATPDDGRAGVLVSVDPNELRLAGE